MRASHIIPRCFGQLDEVLPVNKDGVRESPERCVNDCPYKDQCLEKAMNENSPSDLVKPKCFGQLDEVFPMNEDGIRESPRHCMHECSYKTQCLKKAMNEDPAATEVKEEQVDKAYDSGLITFFDRWSKKKYFKKQKQEKS